MIRLPQAFGIVLGLAVTAVVFDAAGRHHSAPQTGPMLSECDGHLRTLVIQYVPEADFAVPIYRQFLGQLPADVRVYVACPQRADYDQLLAKLGPLQCTVEPIITGHAMTAWSRDRWVALAPDHSGEATTLLAPRDEDNIAGWPARAGDSKIYADLANALSSHVEAERSSLAFDGGDLMADDSNVFVTPAVIKRNLGHGARDLPELKQALARLLGKNVIFLEGAPDHHAGMFMMFAGNHTVLVGDPSLWRPFYPPAGGSPDFPVLPGGADFSPETQARFDSVAATAQAAGYRVIRIPTVPSIDQKTYLTYVNVIIDQRGPERWVYLPQFQGADALNAAAVRVWQSLGYHVQPIDCTTAYRYFGTLHCLVNVLEKS